ncbi:hypothetical protein Syun_007001 [Stephania yunnanensis]|uniref:Uncharacterized protein n=1 Tax=Stephania yunnanensis TaxID=152371 RepID=A0AAP0PZ04_9MAGN
MASQQRGGGGEAERGSRSAARWDSGRSSAPAGRQRRGTSGGRGRQCGSARR